MYKKFDQVWTKLEIYNKSVEKDMDEKLKKMIWLMYLCGK